MEKAKVYLAFILAGIVAVSVQSSPHYGSYYGGGGGYYESYDGRYPNYGHGHGHEHYEGGKPDCVVKPETRTLAELHRRALAEGGKLIVYAGGDAPGQQDETKKAFETAFPGMTVEMIVDFSKYHDARIDYQLATNSVVFDVAQLQTLQDYPRWKKEGVLLNYKPIGWERVRKEFKDSEGSYYGIFMDTFTTAVNTQLLPNNATWPVEAKDYLKPEFKNKIVVTYPNDDDAVLFWFKQVVDKYGFGYLEQFKAQNPKLVRGTQTAIDMVTAGEYPVTMSADAGLRTIPGLPRLVFPKKDPFVLWAQTAAIFKAAKHPEAAKLYLSWQLNKKVQDDGWSFSVRDDVLPPAGYGYKSPLQYNTSHQKFLEFMEDREEVEIFKNQVGLIFGFVQGPSPNGDLGLHPVKAIPH